MCNRTFKYNIPLIWGKGSKNMLIINSGFDVELEGKKFRVDLETADREALAEQLDQIVESLSKVGNITDEAKLKKELDFLATMQATALTLIFKDKAKQVLKLVGHETDNFNYTYALKIILGVINYNEIDDFVQTLN